MGLVSEEWLESNTSWIEQLDQSKIQNSTANQGVKWQVYLFLAPDFGGVHETMSAKRAVNAILRNADINYY